MFLVFFRCFVFEDVFVVDGFEALDLIDEKLIKEEWQAINNFLSFQFDGEFVLYLGKDVQNMIQFLIDVFIGQVVVKIINIYNIEVFCGRFEQLNVLIKFKYRSIYCDVLLKFYGLYVLEGFFVQVVFCLEILDICFF